MVCVSVLCVLSVGYLSPYSAQFDPRVFLVEELCSSFFELLVTNGAPS